MFSVGLGRRAFVESLVALPFAGASVSAQTSSSPVKVAAGSGRQNDIIKLPEDIHIQSNKPRDPLLIATDLTLKPPAGVTIDHIVYPKSIDLTQPGQRQPLAVFSGTVTIDAFLRIGADADTGESTLAGQLRYQACDAMVCFPPARADVQWTLRITPR